MTTVLGQVGGLLVLSRMQNIEVELRLMNVCASLS
jgi:hypothetical protein